MPIRSKLQPEYLHNSRLCWRSLDLAHVPMVHGGHLTIVPGDRDCIPTHFGDNTAVGGITSPINAAAPLETFGFSGIHRPLLIVPYHRQMSFRSQLYVRLCVEQIFPRAFAVFPRPVLVLYGCDQHVADRNSACKPYSFLSKLTPSQN